MVNIHILLEFKNLKKKFLIQLRPHPTYSPILFANNPHPF